MGENDAHPLTEEQLNALVDELQDRLGDSTARTYGRRGVLAALGLATLGTGSASAQASGSVGTQSNPVDVEGYDVTASNSFTDPAGVTHSGELADLSDVGSGTGQWQEVNSGSNIEPIDGETIGTGVEDVDVGSVSTGELAGEYSSLIRVESDSEVVATVDPANSTTPVEDALSASGRGDAVHLPPGASITETGPIYMRDKRTVYGNNAEITITGNSGGLVADLTQVTSPGNFVDGFDILGSLAIYGQGPASGQGGHAIDMIDGLTNCEWTGAVSVWHWDGIAWRERSGSAPFQNQFSHLRFKNVDAGDVDGVIKWAGGGAGSTIRQISAYPSSTGSGQDSTIISGGSSVSRTIGDINIGGSPSRVLTGIIGDVQIDHINYEPTVQNSVTDTLLLVQGGSARVRMLRLNGVGLSYSVDHAYLTFNPDEATYLGSVKTGSSVTVNNATFEHNQSNALNGSFTVEMPATEVNNTHSSVLSTPIFCMADGVYKKSQGTGYDGGTNDRKV